MILGLSRDSAGWRRRRRGLPRPRATQRGRSLSPRTPPKRGGRKRGREKKWRRARRGGAWAQDVREIAPGPPGPNEGQTQDLRAATSCRNRPVYTATWPVCAEASSMCRMASPQIVSGRQGIHCKMRNATLRHDARYICGGSQLVSPVTRLKKYITPLAGSRAISQL